MEAPTSAQTWGSNRSPTSLEPPAETSSPTACRNATSSRRLSGTRKKDGSTSAVRNKTPITTVSISEISAVVVPCSASAATTTCTWRPATATASSRIRYAAIGGSPIPAMKRRTTT